MFTFWDCSGEQQKAWDSNQGSPWAPGAVYQAAAAAAAAVGLWAAEGLSGARGPENREQLRTRKWESEQKQN